MRFYFVLTTILHNFACKSITYIMEYSVETKCECGNELLSVEYWEDENEFCFIQYKYVPAKYSLSRRLKFLFSGKIEYNEIILSSEKAKSISDYIQKYCKTETNEKS